MPKSLTEIAKKTFLYAKGDAQSGIWRHPSKGLASHNIKVFSIIARYLAGLIALFFALKKTYLFPILIIFLLLYCLWSFRKVYLKVSDWKAGLWGIAIQFVSDFSVMAGFVSGLF